MPDFPGPRARLLRILVLLTPAILLFGTAEILATRTIARSSRLEIDPSTQRAIYMMHVGRWPWSHTGITALNRYGYPTDEFRPPLEKGQCTHILFVGDSFVFGDGVDRDSNFVEVVSRELQRRSRPRCVRVFNLGVRGTTIDQQRAHVLAFLDSLLPDLVILGQYENDLTDLTNPGGILAPNRSASRPGGTDSMRMRMAIFKSQLLKYLTYQAFGYFIRNGIERDILAHWSIMADERRVVEVEQLQRTYRHIFTALADTLRHRKIMFASIILPSKLDIMAKRYPEERFFIQLAERAGIPYLRLFPALDSNRNPYPFLMYDGHLSERGNQVVAQAINRWLIEDERSPLHTAIKSSPQIR